MAYEIEVTVTGEQGLDWMPLWSELKEAIPPAYTELMGAQLLDVLRQEAVANA